MSDCPSNVTPSVALNDEILHDHPLTTEEPITNTELRDEFKDINDVRPEDDQVPLAVIVDKEDPNLYIPGSNSASDDEATLEEEETPEIIVDNDNSNTTSTSTSTTSATPKTSAPVSMMLLHHTPATTVTTTAATAAGALDISPISNTALKEDTTDDDDDETDDELMRITEANRFIAVDPKPTAANNNDTTATNKAAMGRNKSLRSQSVSTRRALLVFSDNPTVTKKSDRIIVHNHYGAGPKGALENDLKPKRRSRSYLVACDFSEESFHAIEWTMGTMMRDGDKLYVVTAVNREDNPELVKEAGLSLSKELKKASETVTEEAKKTLGQMLLFDVELITYAICGKVKDVLKSLIEQLPLTMVVCGSRGRGTVKGLLMGSISTYLVHKSPVPVTVIRPQKKKKSAHKRPLHTAPLSQTVKSGQLAVDELSKTPTTDTATASTETKDTPAAATTTTPAAAATANTASS